METKLKLNLIFFGLEFDITRILSEVRVLLKLNIFLLPAMIAAYAPPATLCGTNCRRMLNRTSWKPRV
jgi:hypothetical protein